MDSKSANFKLGTLALRLYEELSRNSFKGLFNIAKIPEISRNLIK
jgi:hypothetical protein